MQTYFLYDVCMQMVVCYSKVQHDRFRLSVLVAARESIRLWLLIVRLTFLNWLKVVMMLYIFPIINSAVKRYLNIVQCNSDEAFVLICYIIYVRFYLAKVQWLAPNPE